MNETKIFKLLAKIKPEYEDVISKDTSLEVICLTSLDKMILICEIEQCIGKPIQLSKIQKLATVGDFRTLINSDNTAENNAE